mgnify:CR=1 FL=1|jgi:hypothetical protein|tara:strand:+ start:246 stop:578 length:333 start_codon:yes stop_codon:yes gene_type:complete
MDLITLTFTQPLNVSIQVGDTTYYSNEINGTDIQIMGAITAVDRVLNTVTTEISTSAARPDLTSFILFSKTASVNTSGLKGYYAEMQFKNNSVDYAELFSVGSDIFVSSK